MRANIGTSGRASLFVAISVVLIMILTSFAVIQFNTGYTSADVGPAGLTADMSFEQEFDDWEEGNGTTTLNGSFARSGGGMPAIAAFNNDNNRPPHYYYITASSDAATSITPEGTAEVLKGTSYRVSFAAKEGNTITGVFVDGKPLTLAQLNKGYYTFTDLKANHTIEVTGKETRTDMSLAVVVKEGTGYVEYSINGTDFIKYEGPVSIPEYSQITLIAWASSGEFTEWRYSGEVNEEQAVSFYDVQNSLLLELYFTKDKSSFNVPPLLMGFLLVIAFLIIAGFVLWLLFFRNRAYEVSMAAHSSMINGKDTARWKKEYTFTVGAGASGVVSYKVGEYGVWKTLPPNPGGEYTIPKGEVTDQLTIEMR